MQRITLTQNYYLCSQEWIRTQSIYLNLKKPIRFLKVNTILRYLSIKRYGKHGCYFRKGHDGDVSAEFTKSMLGEFGVNVASTPTLQKLSDDEAITALGDYIPDAFVKTNLSKLSMEISIPQIYMDNRANGYVPEGLLENGIPAILLSYQLNGSHSRNKSQRETQNNDNAF